MDLQGITDGQGVSCDRFLGRTHAPRTSRLRCARTRVRTPNLKWSHFEPALFKLFSVIFQHFYGLVCSKTE